MKSQADRVTTATKEDAGTFLETQKHTILGVTWGSPDGPEGRSWGRWTGWAGGGHFSGVGTGPGVQSLGERGGG